jgi:hypothetical protein
MVIIYRQLGLYKSYVMKGFPDLRGKLCGKFFMISQLDRSGLGMDQSGHLPTEFM